MDKLQPPPVLHPVIQATEPLVIGAPKQAGDHHAAAELPEAGQPQPSACARLLLGSTLTADHQRPRQTAPTAAFCVPGGGWHITGERCSILEPHLSRASEPRVLFTAVQHSGASVCSGAAAGLQDREDSSWHELSACCESRTKWQADRERPGWTRAHPAAGRGPLGRCEPCGMNHPSLHACGREVVKFRLGHSIHRCPSHARLCSI